MSCGWYFPSCVLAACFHYKVPFIPSRTGSIASLGCDPACLCCIDVVPCGRRAPPFSALSDFLRILAAVTNNGGRREGSSISCKKTTAVQDPGWLVLEKDLLLAHRLTRGGDVEGVDQRGRPKKKKSSTNFLVQSCSSGGVGTAREDVSNASQTQARKHKHGSKMTCKS